MRLVDYSEGEYISFFIHSHRNIVNSNSCRRASKMRSLSAIYPPRPGGYPQISLVVRHRHLDSRLSRTFGASIALLILKLSQLFNLLSERQLFGELAENYSKELHLQYIVECLGQFPLEFLQDCEDRKKYFNKEGERTSPAMITSAKKNVFT